MIRDDPRGAGHPFDRKCLNLCLIRHILPKDWRGSLDADVNVQPKPVRWIGGSKDDLSGFPSDVRRRVGNALWRAQLGRKALYAKPLKGFGDAGVLKVVGDHDGDTFRAVYTVRFARAVYVLHAFQKKSRHGIATPKTELERITRRLRQAREDYEQWLSGETTTQK